MDLTLIIIALAVGLILLTLEIVALPGGVAGLFGIGLIVFGVWRTFVAYGTTWGTIVLVGSAVACGILLAILMKSKTWNKFSLNEESNSKVNQIDSAAVSVGARGVTVARLAPTGKALIDGQLVEVHAINRFIEQDTAIEVVAVDGYRIDVCQCDDNRFDENNQPSNQ